MPSPVHSVLVVGATGSIGRLVVAEALRHGLHTRALVRSSTRADLPTGAEPVEGDLTRAETLGAAVDGVDAVVFTHGSHGDPAQAELVDYGAVRNVIDALDGRAVRIALMTTIGVTKRSAGHDAKRRGERLVRATGWPYTIVRPGWFDYNDDDQHRLVLLQGDRRWAGDPSDGVVSRQQIAEVLVAALLDDAADRRTFELVAEHGSTDDLHPVFEALEADPSGSIDGVQDRQNQPLEDEPVAVRRRLEQALKAKD
jgi:uncharacterized protein YbjT (DUF2867 family)